MYEDFYKTFFEGTQMKYCSIDIETTGIDEETCDIIEIGVVLDDLKNPKPLDQLATYHTYVLPEGRGYVGEPFALSMHGEIFERISSLDPDYTYLEANEVGESLSDFFADYFEYKILAAGKNFGSFDLQFLKKLPEFNNWVTFHHRSLDPSMLYIDLAEDLEPPGLKKCLERAEIGEIAHTALEDALDVVKLIRVAAFGTVDPNQ
jgi:oligoribonuclease (3'-5' exoribonuclease)